ncbi:MAG: histidine phosphatase family protein [Lachnospiraceae bacterium]|nr:histidine phosphatase family protein [Lachnospiraceae bacterium]
MELYVMRHGTTDWNLERRMQGSHNIQLNDEGRALARVTAEALKDLKIDYIYSSPLDRAYETATIIRGDRDIEIVKDDRLKEFCFGEYEGKAPEERPEKVKLFFKDPPAYEPPADGESFDSIIKRTGDFIESVIVPLSEKHPDGRVLVSGHGAMNKALALNLLHRDLKDFWAGEWQKNCCISIYEINGHDFKLKKDCIIFYEEDESKKFV